MTKKDIELLKIKDEKTFEKFYFKYHKLFFSVIYKKVYNFHVAEELVQESFVKIMEDINQYRDGNFKYWVLTITKNIANMYLRKSIREEKYLKEYYEEKKLLKYEVDDSYIKSKQLLNEVKDIVSDEVYEIIIMHLVKNMKFREIAKVKGQTTSAILGKYHRGLKLVRSKIDYEEY